MSKRRLGALSHSVPSETSAAVEPIGKFGVGSDARVFRFPWQRQTAWVDRRRRFFA